MSRCCKPLFLVILAFPIPDRTLAAEEHEIDASWDEEVARLLDVSTGRQYPQTGRRYGQIVRSLFDDATGEQISQAELHPNDGVAIQAAWERIRQTMKGPPYFTDPLQPLTPIEPAMAQRFLGFTVGRLQVAPPEWWTRRFEKLQYFFPAHLELAQNDRIDSALQSATKSYEDHFFPEFITAVRTDEKVLVASSQEREYPIPLSVLHEAQDRGPDELTVSLAPLSEAAFIVAVHHDHAFNYLMYKIHADSGDILWTAKVFVENYLVFGHTGVSQRQHWTEIMTNPKEQQIVIFGACGNSMYIEGFDSVTGDAHFRFSTSY